MQKGFAAKIAERAQDEGLDVKFYVDYSGRGMYGETTTALVGAASDIMVGLALYAFDLSEASDEVGDESIEDLVKRPTKLAPGQHGPVTYFLLALGLTVANYDSGFFRFVFLLLSLPQQVIVAEKINRTRRETYAAATQSTNCFA